MKSINKTAAGTFFESMKNRMGIGSPQRNATDTYERAMKIIPDCISANENEIPVKQYNIAVLRNLLKFERAEGRIQVTNKRVVLRAAGHSVGGRTTLQHEFAINEIAGIEARQNYKFSFLYFVFALLIMLASNLIINVSVPSLSNYLSPVSMFENRVYRIMSPSHINKADANVREAISQRKEAEAEAAQAEAKREEVQRIEARWIKERDEDAVSNPNYLYWYGNQRLTAQAILDLVVPERRQAEEEEREATAALEQAQETETKAIKSMSFAVNSWKVLMTLAGLILGLGGLGAFFMLYKKFGIKLFILNLSIFGFTLSLAATGSAIFMALLILSCITTLVCIFLFCFRPNLIISIKNKGGVQGAVELRRGKGTGFAEIIPTDETEGAIREIGAMIGDIQKLGDSGVQKWVK